MTLNYKIRCDACGEPGLYGRPHITVGMRPSFNNSVRDVHYCSPACMKVAFGNLQPMFTAHGDAFRARLPR